MNAGVVVRNENNTLVIWRVLLGLLVGLAAWAARPAEAELYINEIFWDAGSPVEDGGLAGDDLRDEYIELRGTPGMSLANHYLIFVENEDNSSHTGHAGEIDGIIDFNIADNGGVSSIGDNGFLMLRQKGNLYNGLFGGVAAGTTDLVNSGSGDGWGNNYTDPGSSSVGFSWRGVGGGNQIENGGFTAILIHDTTGSKPPTIDWESDPIGNPGVLVPWDLDHGNNGLDPAASDDNDWRDAWTFVDSIGVQTEGNEVVRGRTYAQMNFGNIPVGGEIIPGTGILFTTPNIEPGAEYYGTPWSGREIEYLGRWGDSTGQTEADWHASNVTQRLVSGSLGGAPDYRQSGDPHPDCLGCELPENFEIESSKNVPYGTPMLATLGETNLIIGAPGLMGDYNNNGTIDAADYTVWRDAFPGGAMTNDDDGMADNGDFDYWRAHFGETSGGGAGVAASTAAAVPEPTSIALCSLAGLMVACCGRRRRT